MNRGNCKQCYFYKECLRGMPESHTYGVWETIDDKRSWMKGHMMDCFKSVEEYRRDIESAKKLKYKSLQDIPKDIVIPENIKYINNEAFHGCDSLNNIIEVSEEINKIDPESFDDKVTDFHISRIAFAIVDGKLHIIQNDKRSHDKWLFDEFGIGSNEFERIPRGYIKGYKVQLYIGKDFGPILSKSMLNDTLEKLIEELSCGYPLGKYRVYNGVIKGNPGEEWVHKEYVGEITVV